MPWSLLLIPVAATLLGGLLAVRLRRWIHALLALGAGLLLGATFLDLLPEAIVIGGSTQKSTGQVLTISLFSFLAFYMLDTVLDSLSAGAHARVPRQSAGRIAGALLVLHSFRDGMAIGAAFLASHGAGYAVTLGIAAHDLGDGMNTVILTTGGDRLRNVDVGFLVADALAPLLGGLLVLRWFHSANNSTALLSVAAGFFLQMAASNFLPEVKGSGISRVLAVACVLAGVGLILGANLLLTHLS